MDELQHDFLLLSILAPSNFMLMHHHHHHCVTKWRVKGESWNWTEWGSGKERQRKENERKFHANVTMGKLNNSWRQKIVAFASHRKGFASVNCSGSGWMPLGDTSLDGIQVESVSHILSNFAVILCVDRLPFGEKMPPMEGKPSSEKRNYVSTLRARRMRREISSGTSIIDTFDVHVCGRNIALFSNGKRNGAATNRRK